MIARSTSTGTSSATSSPTRWRADRCLDRPEQARHLVGLDGVASKGLGAGLGAQRREFCGIARCERHPQPFGCE